MNHYLKFCLPLLATAGLGAVQPLQDYPILSFAITGDTRLDPAYPTALDGNKLPPAFLTEFKKPALPFPFTFNIVQVRQTLKDLQRVVPAPKYLFVTGDLVMGFAKEDVVTSKGVTRRQILEGQLNDFQKGVQVPGGHPPKLVLLPGNHEMTFKTYDASGKPITGDDDADEAAWDGWTRSNGYLPANPNGPGKDALESVNGGHKLRFDQSAMTYSFNDGPAHFVVLNTDTSTEEIDEGGFETEGLIPLPWIKADIEAAQNDPSIKCIFVMGHRPIRPPSLTAPDKKGKPVVFKASDTLSAEVAEPFRKLLITNNKVKAYLVSHVHLFHADTLADKGDAGTRPVQIVAGNGGVDMEAFWQPGKEPGMAWRSGETKGPFYGFTVLQVYASGKVTYNSWQREPPVPYYGAYKDMSKAAAQPRPSDTVIK